MNKKMMVGLLVAVFLIAISSSILTLYENSKDFNVKGSFDAIVYTVTHGRDYPMLDGAKKTYVDSYGNPVDKDGNRVDEPISYDEDGNQITTDTSGSTEAGDSDSSEAASSESTSTTESTPSTVSTSSGETFDSCSCTCS